MCFAGDARAAPIQNVVANTKISIHLGNVQSVVLKEYTSKHKNKENDDVKRLQLAINQKVADAFTIKEKFPGTIPEPETPSDIELAFNFVRSLDHHDFDAVEALIDPECESVVQFGEMHMQINNYLDEITRLYDAFLDLAVGWDVFSKMESGEIKLEGFHFTGTHTGVPYAFGPYPEMPANGKRVMTDPERVLLEVKEGKLVKITFSSPGELANLLGIYRLVGGFPV